MSTARVRGVVRQTSPVVYRGREVLPGLLLAAVALAACTGPADDAPAAATSASAPATAPATATASAPAAEPLPAVKPWSPNRRELHPEVKRAATRFVEAAGTWDDAQGSPARVAARVRDLGVARAAARDAARLADEDARSARLRVVYPQFGGLTPWSASVMVLAEQTLRAVDGATRRRTLVLDVRLERSGSRAQVRAVPPPVVRTTRTPISATARKVLRTRNIRLAAPARQDVRSGDVDDAVLRVLARLANRYTIDVLVLHTGHPRNVYATDRISNHTEGRAVDIWRIDGVPVVRAPRALLRGFLAAAGAAGATEVGGPFDLNGAGGGYFTDEVHSDHVHVGLTPGRPAAQPPSPRSPA